MSAKEYNPVEHSVVQAFLKADVWNRYEVDRHGFVACLIHGIIDELKRVYWNVKQEKLEDRDDWDFVEISGFEYRRYFWGDCDCGAESPVHAKDCRQEVERNAWCSRRMSETCDAPQYTQDGWPLGSTIRFDKFDEWEKNNPFPPCTCGASENWKERDHHLSTCSPSLPNMAFGEVRINWYKYPCRGTSCNVDWDEKQWRIWYDALILTLGQWEWDNERHHHGKKRPEPAQ